MFHALHLPTSMNCFFFSLLDFAACFSHIFACIGLLSNQLNTLMVIVY